MSHQNFRPSSKFGNIANEVLRTGVPQSNFMSPYPVPYGYPPPMYGFPPQGFPPYPMPFMPPVQLPVDDDDSEEEEFEVMVKLIDKQRDILERFVSTLNKNKESIMKNRAKEMSKQIKALEKEGVVRQLKLDGEQARLMKKLKAPYEFDGNPYELSDITDSDDDDDDILLELLSNKAHFKKVQALLKKKKKHNTGKKKGGAGSGDASPKSPKSPKKTGRRNSDPDESGDQSGDDHKHKRKGKKK